MDGESQRQAIPQVIAALTRTTGGQDETDGCNDRGALSDQHIMAQGQPTQSGRTESMQTASNVTKVAPALEKYAQGPLADLGKRPGLTPRDRSLATIAALTAPNHTIELPPSSSR